jgi:hypothetical protein
LESLVLQHGETNFGEGLATSLILFQSELTRKGAIHTPLHLIDGNGNVSSK